MKIQDHDLLRRQAYLGGEWVDADSGLTLTVTDPANGEVIAEVPDMGMAETRRAILAAETAWPAWRVLTAGERSQRLRLWHDLMLESQEDLARIMTAEQGKPLA
ncbi:MAG: aldehyde dehydrogenase family protein, partial [Saprospiraceae bacterium]